MKLQVGDIVKFGWSVNDVSLRGKVGRVVSVHKFSGCGYEYGVDTFIPHPVSSCTHFSYVSEHDLILLERPIDKLKVGDKIQLDEEWYVDSIISANTVAIAHTELSGTINIARKHVKKVD